MVMYSDEYNFYIGDNSYPWFHLKVRKKKQKYNNNNKRISLRDLLS